MQFSTTSDYAIRTVLYLALNQDRCCPASEIESSMGVPALYLNKVTKKLKAAGIIRTVQGHGGGYTLLRPSSEISLYDILSLTEQTMQINGCLEDVEFCSRHATEICPVRKVYGVLNHEIKRQLQAATVQKLLT